VTLVVVRNVEDDGVVVRALADHPHLMLRQRHDLYVLGPESLTSVLRDLPGIAAGASRPLQPGTSLKVARRGPCGGDAGNPAVQPSPSRSR
jgi:purine catabolism regulator